MSNKYVRLLVLFGVTAMCCLAQSSPFGQAVMGVATEMIALARWLGIIMCIICGLMIMAGGHYMMAKIGGLIIGLVFALFASPLVTWFQAL